MTGALRGRCIFIAHSPHVETIVYLSHKSPDSVINVKVEFGKGKGKVPLDAIAERAKKYQPKPKITYKMIYLKDFEKETERKIAEQMIRKGKMTLEEIADCVSSLSFDELKELEAEVMQLA